MLININPIILEPIFENYANYNRNECIILLENEIESWIPSDNQENDFEEYALFWFLNWDVWMMFI